MRHPTQYRGQEVVVLGLARSGHAVAKLFHQSGAKVVASDRKPRHECPEADELEALGIDVICGEHPDGLIHEEVALVVKNPGIPYRVPPIVRALELGIEVVSEVEVAYHVLNAPLIGITGSNGKTTTTTWIGKMLALAGMRPVVAGNIGTPLSVACSEVDEQGWLVAELSSFQLKGTAQFKPRIACLLNVYETHLDYHGTMEDYVASKVKLFANQTADDIAVLNADDPTCMRIGRDIASRPLLFSTTQALETGVCLASIAGEKHIVYRDQAGRETVILPTSRIGVKGRHNLENALAATAVALSAGVDIKHISEALESFGGVEHRMELVGEKHGVRIYNDSKATNPTSTMMALEGLSGGVVLIAGGQERGMEYEALLPQFRDKLVALIALGETSGKLAAVAERAGVPLIQRIEGDRTSAGQAMRAAVDAAFSAAVPGGSIILSPACASWDMFTSYEERGHMFKEAVHNL